ncbi:redoxin domain-containing protein [Aquibacillus koreensis]|uniref:Redoxin domain-containing protein n=1 Tax=Aquibacillus koreensis TaxID=279446 RepID=A0A9X3WN94_9BACI|nr:redoxin domain-containing protein [Aquibacillus koreensis]MCT2536010.1 redoxin domain-containing protein [Aquibacillus koreensis]MDC3420466.1 redoxin domain-containing protein [Aquibacillus koreensis]
MATFELGQSVPDFTLPAVSGVDYNFENYRDQNKGWHLIIFFRGSWCPACMEELKQLEESKGYFDDKYIHITTISTDHLDALEKMVDEHDFTFPVLTDESLEALEAYHVHYHKENAPYEDHDAHGEPAYFLINEQGNLLYQQRQTSPFGRPSPRDLRKIIKYISKNLK